MLFNPNQMEELRPKGKVYKKGMWQRPMPKVITAREALFKKLKNTKKRK